MGWRSLTTGNFLYLTELHFPVLSITAEGYPRAWVTAQDFQTSASWSAFRRGYFAKLTLVDRDGSFYKVQRATRVGFAAPLWGPIGGWLPFFDPRVKVELQLMVSGRIEFSQVRETLCREVGRRRAYWSGIGLEPDQIRRARTFTELFQMFVLTVVGLKVVRHAADALPSTSE